MKKIVVGLYPFLVTVLAHAQTYKYDNNQQVIEVKYDNGLTTSIQYDANGNRVSYVTSGAPLPVTVLNFNAEKSGEQVLLTWTTAQEINTNKFEIEYSKDAVAFSTFTIVPAKGNTSNKSDYSTIHCCPNEGVNFYRLKMIDKDGSFKYSDVRKVIFEVINTLTIYPNPTNHNSDVNITFKRSFKTDAFVNIYNATGALVYHSILPKQKLLLQVNAKLFAAGVYNVIVISEEAIYKGRFIKQ